MLTATVRGRHSKAAYLTVALLVLAQPRLSAAQPASTESGADAAQADVELAERNAASAFEAYRAGRFGTAVSLYVQSYNAAPNADVLYNIARIYDTKLGDRKLAMTFYRRYIADPGAMADRIKSSNERLVMLREADIAADQAASVSRPESVTSTARSAATDRAASDRTWSNQELVGAVVGAAGIVGVSIGAAFGVAALSGARTARDLCDGNACREQRGVNAARDASQNARVSTVGFAVGGALLGIGTALFLSADNPTERAQSARVQWAPLASKSSVALEVSGAW